MTKDLLNTEPYNIDADPVNFNWIRILSATRENRPEDIVRLSAGQYSLEEAIKMVEQHARQSQPQLQQEPQPDLPFVYYPEGGRTLLRIPAKGSCRHGYGLTFMQATSQTHCAYCNFDLTASYRNWLQMTLDHVVPEATAKKRCIRKEWWDDASNKVLACAACNHFNNRHPLPDTEPCPETLEAFYDLRDHVFLERKAIADRSHQTEMDFFNSNPWVIAKEA